MIKRTIHLRDNSDECLKAIYMSLLKDNVKNTNYSRVISDALEFYFYHVKKYSGKEIDERFKNKAI